MFTFFVNSEAQSIPLALTSTSSCSDSFLKDLTFMELIGVGGQGAEIQEQHSSISVKSWLTHECHQRVYLVINYNAVIKNSDNRCYC